MRIKLGDIIQLGVHRLMCGDARVRNNTDMLFGSDSAAVTFTSPPYAQQRVYDTPIGDWTSMMIGSLGDVKQIMDGQVLVNIGIFYRDGSWVDYWSDWLREMERLGWMRIGWYVWDKLCGLPTVPQRGRLYPSHEFIFHLCRNKKTPNKTVPCKGAGKTSVAGPMRRPNNDKYRSSKGEIVTGDKRIADSVFRLTARGSNVSGHDAVFPVGLPKLAFEPWSHPGDLVYDPFAGSGTSIIAAQESGRRCLAMEISPKYCELTVSRFAQRFPHEAVTI